MEMLTTHTANKVPRVAEACKVAGNFREARQLIQTDFASRLFKRCPSRSCWTVEAWWRAIWAKAMCTLTCAIQHALCGLGSQDLGRPPPFSYLTDDSALGLITALGLRG